MNFNVNYEGENTGWEQNTGGNFSQAFGCFSSRLKLPEQGLFNASFWMCSEFKDHRDPSLGRIEGIYNPKAPGQNGIEIDVFEYTSSLGALTTQTVHWNGWSNYNQRLGTKEAGLPTKEALYDDYHIYSVVWTEDAYYMYIDEHLSWYYTGEGVGYGEVMILLQLVPYWEDMWLGTYVEGEVPYTMSWDWIRVWTLDDLDWSKTNKPKQ